MSMIRDKAYSGNTGNRYADAQYDVREGMGLIGPYLLTFYTQSVGDKSDFLVFPVAPRDIKAEYAYRYNEFEIVGAGEAAIRGGLKLASLTFESFFPRDYDPTLVDGYYWGGFGLKKPWEFEQLIHQIRVLGRPVQLVIGGTNINWTATIRDFRIEHRGGEPGDLYFSIDFKKHYPINVEKREADSPALGRTRPKPVQAAPSVGKAVRDGTSGATKTDPGWFVPSRGYTMDGINFVTVE